MWTWIVNNKDWLFSGIGVMVIGALYALFTRKRNQERSEIPMSEPTVTQVQTVNIVGVGSAPGSAVVPSETKLKDSTHILFVDDDRKFKIVSILKKMGWKNTEIVTDIQRIDSEKLRQADIVFVDIQGVGLKLGFADQGLGLATAIRERYPEKKIVIYSALTGHDPFAKGFKAANERLRKSAEPYEFEKTIIDLLT
jgi:hypothetical protein